MLFLHLSFSLHAYICAMCMQYLQKPERVLDPLELVLTDSCEPP